MKQIVFLFFFFSCSFKSLSQPTKTVFSFKTNKVNLNDSLKKIKNDSYILFLCPLRPSNKDSILFEKKINEICKNRRLVKNDSLSIVLVFFNGVLKSANDGLTFNVGDTSIQISQFNCFIIKPNKDLFDRAFNQLKLPVKYKCLGNQSDIYKLSLDTTVCIKSIVELIPIYSDLIIETFNPEYSVDEQFSQLKIEINRLEEELIREKEKNAREKHELQSEIYEINKRIKMLEDSIQNNRKINNRKDTLQLNEN